MRARLGGSERLQGKGTPGGGGTAGEQHRVGAAGAGAAGRQGSGRAGTAGLANSVKLQRVNSLGFWARTPSERNLEGLSLAHSSASAT